MKIETRDGWKPSGPIEYEDEGELHRLLHSLIKENPRGLPLAGDPILTALGCEIGLGSGSADILAIEFGGRPVIIEVKLSYNSETRKDMVPQILYYAAFLKGYDVTSLEKGPLSNALTTSGYSSIFEAVQVEGGADTDEAESFNSSLQAYLDRGDFRLVLALDNVPPELERFVAYLDEITNSTVTTDLIALPLHQVGDGKVPLPQRIVPDPNAASPIRFDSSAAETTYGSDAFRASIMDTFGKPREVFDRLIFWAEELAKFPGVRLRSHKGQFYTTLSPLVPMENVGMVTVYNQEKKPAIQLQLPVIRRRASDQANEKIREVWNTYVRESDNWKVNPPTELLEPLMEALTEAYQESGS